jgi:hypothetical protein
VRGVAVWFSDDQLEILGAAVDRLIPPDDASPGARVAGVADYVDALLGAFEFDPPRIWAGGPFSGRHGGDAEFENFLPLGRIEELAWRIRIEGSRALPERELNGPVVGLQERFAAALEGLGTDFASVDPDEQDRRLAADPEVRALLYEYACEGMYGDPVYGGNRDGAAWRSIGFTGDVQPRGWTDVEVSGP